MRKTVLIVDDHEINRRILKNLLRDEYDLLEAENGRVAMELLTREDSRVSAVLLDLLMPEMDGLAVLRAMAEEPELADIPVLVASQIDRRETEIEVLEAGARDFVPRPYEPLVLKKRLANLIELRDSASSLLTVERDSLTGLYTKEAFYRHALQILRQSADREFTLVSADIERFKLVNDSFGPAEGDRLLRFLATRLRQRTRTANGICARFHGDVFFALVPGRIPPEEFSRLVETAEEQLRAYPLNMQLSLKFGIYQVGRGDTTPISLMCDRAKLAADSAKGQYHCVSTYYDDSLRRRLLREQKIADAMSEALQTRQFEIYYQPKYDLRNEQLAGAEALVRWNHPELGFMSPAEFIPLFERNGFITELDLYVWDMTCRQIVQWAEQYGKYVPISVNVSRKDIYQDDLPQVLLGLVQRHNLLPRQLHLEITETAYTENPDQLIRVVSQLKQLGFVIEMDDFGSGYSSLNMLSELPIDVLKLDMRFIQKETEKPDKRNILSFIISLAKWMNLLVVAEGVETAQQIDILRDLECTYVQGYYFSRPMPATDFLALLLESEDRSGALPDQDWSTQYFETSALPGAKTMLIVDDSDTNRTVLAETFREIYTITEAENGYTAYTYVEQHFDEIAVIMLDLVMPVMDGYALLQKLKANPLYETIPVIVTSQLSGDMELRAFELGASDCLPKPYQPTVAIHRVQNVTARSTLQAMTQEKEMLLKLKQLEREAKTDPLTGLYNRTQLENDMSLFLSGEPGRKAVFFMLDIDNFKSINDQYGHDCGDTAIQKVAEQLRLLFREKDVICRMGGDEFAVLMKCGMDKRQLSRRLERICEQLRFSVGQSRITCSVGACQIPDHGNRFEDIYHNADVALLTAKRLGKNRAQIFGSELELPASVLYRSMDWLLDESSDAIVVCDANTYEAYYMNNVACAMAGKKKEQCLGRPCYEAVWGMTAPCAHCLHSDQLSREYTEREIHPQGSDRSFLVKGKLIDWGDRPARIQYIQDNTDRARLYRELKELSDDRKMLLELLPGGMIRYDAATQKLNFVSENTLRMLGYSREEFSARFDDRFDLMVWPEDRERVLREIDDQISHGEYDVCEYHIQRRDGSLCWVHDMGYLKTDEKGNEFYVVITDITALKQAETENRMLAQQLSTIVNRMPGALCLYHWDGKELNTLQRSRQFLTMVGWDDHTLESNTKRLVTDQVHESDVTIVREAMSLAMHECRPSDCIFRIYKGFDQKCVWLRMQIAPDRQADGSVLLYVLYTDETELREPQPPRPDGETERFI